MEIAVKAMTKQMEDLKNSPTQMSGTSDTISRQAAIDAIINRTVTVDTDDKWLSGHAQCELEIIDIINALPSAEPKQQWIPCSERLPDKEGQYLVTDEAGGVVSIICDVFFHYDDGAPTWLLSQNVVAWMPLPKGYSGE